jgi:hypothetical protein
MPDFLGFDHIDTRVTSVAAVEPFYDQLMPMLGLSRKHYAFVDPQGEWGGVGSPNAEHTLNDLESHIIIRVADRLQEPKRSQHGLSSMLGVRRYLEA